MSQLISNVLMQPRPTDAVERPMTLIEKLEQNHAELEADYIKMNTPVGKANVSGNMNGIRTALNIVKQHQPTIVYELIYDGCDCYYSIMHSLNKAVCERFIEQVREYDALYEPLYNASWAADGDDEEFEQAKDTWEENHPLRPWSDEIHGEYGHMEYYLSECGFKSYARNLSIKQHTLDKAENK